MNKFVDSCDSSRTLVPIRSLGTETECKVYFNGNYSGNARVPTRLLVSRPRNEREVRQEHFIGYVATK